MYRISEYYTNSPLLPDYAKILNASSVHHVEIHLSSEHPSHTSHLQQKIQKDTYYISKQIFNINYEDHNLAYRTPNKVRVTQ